MKSKIQDIINGKFYQEDGLVLSPEGPISFSVIENEVYRGSFIISGSEGQAVRGYVSCEHARIKITENIFNAANTRVNFIYDPKGLSEGFRDEGRFIIHSNAGEYIMPFLALVTRKYFQTSIGNIKTLNDFTNLCKLNWDEALKVFEAPHFSNLFSEDPQRCAMLRENLPSGGIGSSTSMEEFLRAAGKKELCTFSASEGERSYDFRTDRNIRGDIITITKSDWGFPDVSLKCDRDFIKFDKSRLDMSDFNGMTAHVAYKVIPLKMHSGKNTAVITLGNCYKEINIKVKAYLPAKAAASPDDIFRQRIIAKLERLYVRFRIGQLEKETWEEESDALLKTWMDREKDGILNRLIASYIYIICDRDEEARELLGSLSKKVVSGYTPLAAFYIFLNSYFEDQKDKRSSLNEVKNIYLRYPEEPLCAWILLQFDYALERNPSRRFNMIKEYALRYSTSPLFYLEAALVLRDNPQLLSRQDIFEDRLVVWMSRKGLLSRNLASRILDISSSKKEFSYSFFRVMVHCNRILKEDGAVKAVCAYLIRMNCYSEEYFPWYAKGVSLHFKLAGLYEAYMLSCSRTYDHIPGEILKYFLRGCHLPPQKRAMLYTYALTSEETPQSDKAVYTAAASAFAAAELKKIHLKGLSGNINEELILLCRELEKSILPLEWYSMKYDIDSCCALSINASGITRVIICADPHLTAASAKAGKRSASYKAENGQAYVYIYNTPCTVFLEDERGVRRLAGPDRVSAVNMMSGEEVDLFAAAKDAESTENVPAGEYAGESESAAPGALKERLELFAGTNEEMLLLIEEARDAHIDTLAQEKDLLDIMLFTDNFPVGHEMVFEHLKDADDMNPSLLAYAVRFSREWLLDEYELTDELAEFIEDKTFSGQLKGDFAAAALLKRYFMYPQTDSKKAAESLFKNFFYRDMYFPFYASAPADLKNRYMISGMGVISCRSIPGRRLFADIVRNIYVGARTITPAREHLPMKEVLPGIYTVCVFPVYSETMQYYIRDDSDRIIGSGKLTGKGEKDESSAAAKLGDIAKSRAQARKLSEFAELEDMTSELFAPVYE